jgi:tetratricopeptide (TPR) repeat protein
MSFFKSGWRSACTLALAIAIVDSLNAQPAISDQIAKAAMLNDKGRFAEAIRVVEPLLASEKPTLGDGQIATVWNLRGVALQGLGDYENARRSYELSIHLLRGDVQQRDELAAVLDNFGSLKAVVGQLRESESLRLHAVELYRSVNDHTGAARTYANLALLAVALRKKKDASSFIAEATGEESMISQEGLLELASIESARALVDEMKGHHADAIGAIDRAIELWSKYSGPASYPVGICYGLRGKIHGNQHMFARALDDVGHSLALLRATGDETSSEYAVDEMIFGKLLRNAGMTAQARHAESDAQMRLNSLGRRKCDQCPISAESFR